MSAQMVKDDATDALRVALIEADIITEHRLGEGRADADDVIGILAELDWVLVSRKGRCPRTTVSGQCSLPLGHEYHRHD